MNSITNNRQKIKVNYKMNFDGGNLSSDSGLILFEKFIENFNLKKLVKKSMDFNNRDSICFWQRVHLTLAGYTSDLVLKDLQHDSIFNKMVGVSNLYSQSTMSRFDNSLNKKSLEKFNQLNLSLLEKAYKKKLPKTIILDIDSTGIKTFGNQDKQSYNGHYQEVGFHPLMVFDGITGDLIKTSLRPGNVYTSNGVVDFIKPILKWYKEKFPEIKLLFRGDSGFAIPDLYEILEEYNVLYSIRLKANSKLHKSIKTRTDYFDASELNDSSKHLIVYDEIEYQAASWEKKRLVKVKIDRKPGELILNSTYVVTNEDNNPKETIDFYSNRGTMENFIKEVKNGFGMKNMSHSNFITNQNKMAQLMIIYNLNNIMRRLVFPKELIKCRIETIRYKFIKVASKFISSGRKCIFKLSSSYPYKDSFYKIIENIVNLSRV